MTPSEFYKRFGHETSWYYSGGVFTIDNMYKEWNVDKSELREICKYVSFIEDHGGKKGFKKMINQMKDNSVDEFVFDGSLMLIHKDVLKDILNKYGDLL